MHYDNLLKTIFLDAMPAMLRALHCAPVVEYLTVEFPPRPKLIADVVARLADGKILHMEFQVSNDPRMHWRCYHYFGAIQEQWEDAEVIQIVVYLGNGLMTMQPIILKPSLTYKYQLLDIREIPAKVFLDSPNDVERVLALLCESTEPRELIRNILASWRNLPGNVLFEHIDRLKTLSNLRGHEIITAEELHRMPFELDITTSLFFKEAYEVAYPKAYNQAYNQAYTAAEAAILARNLEHLFGPLPQPIHERIAAASKDELEHWNIRVLRAQHLDDVFQN